MIVRKSVVIITLHLFLSSVDKFPKFLYITAIIFTITPET